MSLTTRIGVLGLLVIVACGQAVASELPESVIDYGAIPDDGIDDTAAIQAALDDGFAYLPPGTYLASGLEVDNPDVVIRGHSQQNVIIGLPDGADDTILRLSAPGFLVEHLTIDGNNTANISGSGIIISATGTIRQVSIRDTAEYGLRVNGGPSASPEVRGLIIESSTFSGTGKHALFVRAALETRLVNITVDGTATSVANGIWLGNGSDGSTITTSDIRDIGNIGIEVWNAAAVIIANNHVENAGSMGISSNHNHDGTVIGNTVINPATIGIENAQGNPTVITGNTVVGAARPISASGDGQVTVITGNTFRDSSKGIQIGHAGAGTIIAANLFDNVGSGGAVSDGRSVYVNQSPFTRVYDNTFTTVAGDALKHRPVYLTGSSVPSFVYDNFVYDPDGIYANPTISANDPTHIVDQNWVWDGSLIFDSNQGES